VHGRTFSKDEATAVAARRVCTKHRENAGVRGVRNPYDMIEKRLVASKKEDATKLDDKIERRQCIPAFRARNRLPATRTKRSRQRGGLS
jgi:hypothetical protein